MSKGNYKVKVYKVVPEDKRKEIFKYPCCLGVSLNNAIFWNEEKLATLLKWMDNNFASCLIVIVDELHRHTERIFNDIDEIDATHEAKKMGDKLYAIFAQQISEYPSGKFKLQRWNTLTKRVDIQREVERIYDIFNKDKVFNEEIQKASIEFLRRQKERGNIIVTGYEDAIRYSNSYVVEEMAYFGVLAAEGNPVLLYPGTQLDIMKRIGNGEFPEYNLPLCNGIFVDLKIKK